MVLFSFAFLKWVGKTYEQSKESYPAIEKIIARFDSEFGSYQANAQSCTRERIENFLRRPFFQRRWIIQETSVGKGHLRCGNSTIAWNSANNGHMAGVETLSSWNDLTGMQSTVNPNTPAAVRFRTSWGGLSNKLLAPLQFLDSLHGHDCKDLRDRIAALQSLWWRPESEEGVDYSLSIEDNYFKFAIQQLRPGLLWCAAERIPGMTTNQLNLPSWVPVWRVAPQAIWHWKELPDGCEVVEFDDGDIYENTLAIVNGNLELPVLTHDDSTIVTEADFGLNLAMGNIAFRDEFLGATVLLTRDSTKDKL